MGRALSKEPERAWGSARASEQTKAALEEVRPFRSARGDPSTRKNERGMKENEARERFPRLLILTPEEFSR